MMCWKSSNHLLSLINDILDISKTEEGKMELKRSEVNVRSLMEKSLFMIREKAVKHKLALSIDTDDLLPVIQADERKLKQVMYNLLSNAVKFTPDGGDVKHAGRQIDPALLPTNKIGDCLARGERAQIYGICHHRFGYRDKSGRSGADIQSF